MSIYRKKPRILADIRSKSDSSVFNDIKESLGYKIGHFRRIPKTVKNFIVVVLVLTVFISFSGGQLSILAPTAFSISPTDDERKALEQELEKIEQEIDEQEGMIISLQNEQKTLSRALNVLNAEISKLNLQIKATDIQLRKLDTNIFSLKNNIGVTEDDIGKLRIILAGYLRQIYDDDGETMLEMFLGNDKLSDFFSSVEGLALIQEEMRTNLEEFVELKTNLIFEKDILVTERSDVLNLKKIKENQKIAVNAKQKEKQSLIDITKGQESQYQSLLAKSKQTAAQIRSRIFEFLGGGELSFGEAYKLAKFASEQTGIRAAFILSILSQESNFGSNVGKCNWKTAMSPKRDQQPFLQITSELNIDPDSVSVSCPIKVDGAYGGAMGPAQFIPATWMIYKDEIAALTGNNPPSPWRNIDAIMATAIYTKDNYNSSSCVDYANKNNHILPVQTLQERCAAAKYYAGSNWFLYRFKYGDPVVQRANRFQADIDSMESDG